MTIQGEGGRTKAEAGPQAQELMNTSTETSQQVSYFDEGAGFAYVAEVGSGIDGTASLVKSTANGKLYVRKEDRYSTEANYEEVGPSAEIEIAKRMKHIPGVAQIKGWRKYERAELRQLKSAFYVSYWDYCNMGTIWSLHAREHYSREISIPDRWLLSWVASMLRTVIDLHRNGVAHHDAHGNNWFLHWDDSTDTPNVVLGDFGQAREFDHFSATGPRTREGLLLRPDLDYIRIGNIADTIAAPARGATEKSSSREKLSGWSEEIFEHADGGRGPVLEAAMIKIADAIEEEIKYTPVPTSEETSPLKPETVVGVPVMERLKRSDYKNWKIVWLEDGNIVPESLQTRNMGDVRSTFCREGDWDRELNPRPMIESLAFI